MLDFRTFIKMLLDDLVWCVKEWHWNILEHKDTIVQTNNSLCFLLTKIVITKWDWYLQQRSLSHWSRFVFTNLLSRLCEYQRRESHVIWVQLAHILLTLVQWDNWRHPSVTGWTHAVSSPAIYMFLFLLWIYRKQYFLEPDSYAIKRRPILVRTFWWSSPDKDMSF